MGGMVAFLDEGTWLRETGVPILVTLVIAVVATFALRVVVRRFQRKLEQAPSLSKAGNLQRAATLTHALSATLMVTLWTVASLVVLGYLNVNLAPLIASAGIAGVALGFGAQSIVKDGLSGFFILLENQFGVGDTVEVRTPANPVLGRIEWFTLRATALRALRRDAQHRAEREHGARQQQVARLGPRDRRHARRLPARSGARPRGARRAVRGAPRAEGTMQDWVMDGPSVLGVETTSDTGVVIRTIAETRPSKKPEVERLLRAKITQRLTERGIRAPVGAAPPSASTQ